MERLVDGKQCLRESWPGRMTCRRMMTVSRHNRKARLMLGLMTLMLVFVPAVKQHAQNVPAAEPEMAKLTFQDAPLQQVLDFYALMTGRTLLQAPGVRGTITLRSQTKLTKSQILQAIESVLAMNNITLIPVDEKFLKVVPITIGRQQGDMKILPALAPGAALPATDTLVSQLVPLQYIEIAEAQKAIDGLKHSYAKIQGLERINSLLITDSAINVRRMMEILQYIDKPLVRQEELRIIQVRHTKASEVKKKLEEIITQAQPKDSALSSGRVRTTGAPGFERRTTPGIIRAPRTTAPATSTSASAAVDEVKRDLIQGQVKMVADDRTNILIIITRPGNLEFLERMVIALDVVTEPDVLVEVIRLEFADAEDIAGKLNTFIGGAMAKDEVKTTGTEAGPPRPAADIRSRALEEYINTRYQSSPAEGAAIKSKIGELSAANIKVLPDKRTNSLLIMASKADLMTLAELVKAMDIMLSQVRIEALVLEVNLDKTHNTGVAWIQRSLIGLKKDVNGNKIPKFAVAGQGGAGDLPPKDATAFLSPSHFATGAGLTYYFSEFGIGVDAILKSISTDSRTEILSSPRIVTTDNKQAVIDVSRERYFYKGQKFVSTGGSGAGEWVDDVEMRKVGIRLEVTPHINEKKFVLMDILQKVENIAGVQEINDVKWPIVASRDFSAQVAVSSGETIVLGGLVIDHGEKSRSKVPFLGDIPLLGALFRSSEKQKQQSEVVVFITPTVLDTPEEIAADAQKRYDSINSKGRTDIDEKASDSKLLVGERKEEDEAEPRETPETTPEDAAQPENLPPVGTPVVKEFDAGSATIDDVDPEILRFIARQEKRWGKSMQKVDKRIKEEQEEGKPAPKPPAQK